MERSCLQDELSGGNTMQYLFLSGMAERVIRERAIRKEALVEGRRLGISIPDERLQSFADAYRTARGLHSSQEMIRFLNSRGLSVDDFEAYCEESLMLALLKNHLADAESVTAYFMNFRSRFDWVRVSRITVADENLARELVMRVTEDGEEFHSLARQYSLDAFRGEGGYAGRARRGSFPPDAEAKLFNARPGEIHGPFQVEKQYVVFLVEDAIKAELNETIVEEVKECIFSEWMDRVFQTGSRITP